MKRAFVVSPFDVQEFGDKVLSHLEEEPIVCACYGRTDYSHMTEVDKLRGAEEVYFVISNNSLLSTAQYQLVLSAHPVTEGAKRYLLRLDDAEIRDRGGWLAKFYKSLPESSLV